jgi:2-dehydro-3-deoxy-D-arabinonate dehydratase
VRADSRWNVPEPELTLVINRRGAIVGYCAGNDVSSRDIEGENPLYLPQAKVYNGSCALGPGIALADVDTLRDLAIGLKIARGGQPVFEGETRTSRMKRSFEDLAAYLYRELEFPRGAFLMTGSGIVPHETFSLTAGDRVRVEVGGLALENETRS